MTRAITALPRLEASYDAIPRVDGVRAEEIGPFVLFIREGSGWPYYARPRRDATTVTVADIQAVRARQRELGVPEAFEWVHEIVPGLLPAAEAAGLVVQHAPLMVLDPTALPAAGSLTRPPAGPETQTGTDAGVTVRLLDPDEPGFAEAYAASRATAHIGFANGGTAPGDAGPAERDAATVPADQASLHRAAADIRAGRGAIAVAQTPQEGIVATGGIQTALDAAEVVGVATLPMARRRGLGAAISAALARHALDTGYETVFISASSQDVARVYARIGFHRVGTACIAAPA